MSSPRTDADTQEALQKLLGDIGKYDLPAGSKVDDYLDNEGVRALHKGASDNKEAPNRKAFLTELFKVLNDTSTDFKGTATDPNVDAVSRVDLFGGGEKGAALEKLYIKALEEERDSIAFRDAVFLKATERKAGPAWKDRLVLWVAGPSASGKSHTRGSILNECATKMTVTNPSDKSGNLIVSIDGGIERELSQMRSVLLQVALAKGYPGVKDLDKKTKLGIKSKVQKAALATNDPNKPLLHLVIPNTFSNPKTTKKLEQFQKMKGVAQFFSEITGTNQEDFQATVKRGGEMRAWAKEYGSDTAKMKHRALDLNKQPACESKKYNGKHFVDGQAGSETAAKAFTRLNQTNKDRYIKVTSDSIFVVQNTDGTVRKATSNDNSGTAVIRATERQLKDFSERRKTNSDLLFQDYLNSEAGKTNGNIQTESGNEPKAVAPMKLKHKLVRQATNTFIVSGKSSVVSQTKATPEKPQSDDQKPTVTFKEPEKSTTSPRKIPTTQGHAASAAAMKKPSATSPIIRSESTPTLAILQKSRSDKSSISTSATAKQAPPKQAPQPWQAAKASSTAAIKSNAKYLRSHSSQSLSSENSSSTKPEPTLAAEPAKPAKPAKDIRQQFRKLGRSTSAPSIAGPKIATTKTPGHIEAKRPNPIEAAKLAEQSQKWKVENPANITASKGPRRPGSGGS